MASRRKSGTSYGANHGIRIPFNGRKNYEDRYITERVSVANPFNLSPPKNRNRSVSPPHVARIASVTGIRPTGHDLSPTETSHGLFTLSSSLKENNLPLQPRLSVSYTSRGVNCPRWRTQTTRPEHILDAPRMVSEDEWGCGNVMSWLSETGLFVGLGKQIFSLNTKTSVVSSFGTTNSDIMSLEMTMSGKMILLRLQNGEVHYADASPNIAALMIPSQPKDRARSCCHRERKFAIGDCSGHLKLLDIRSPRDTQKFAGHASSIYGLGWSDDGNYIASSGADKTLKVWDLRMMPSPKPLLIKRGFASPVKKLTWCPWQRSVLAFGEDDLLHRWNLDTGSRTATIATASPINNIIYSTQSKHILTTHGFPGNSIMLHRDPSMTAMSTVFTISRAHNASVVHAAFDPKGEILATGSGGDETVRLWRILERPRTTSRSFEGNLMDNNQVLR